MVWPGSKPMKKLTFVLALLLPAALLLGMPARALGATMQQSTMQAFRLLSHIGLVDSLPATDQELAQVNEFELARMVIQASERLQTARIRGSAASPEGMVRVYLSRHRTPDVQAGHVVESITALEQTYESQMRLLGKVPFFSFATEGASASGAVVFGDAVTEQCEVYAPADTLLGYRLLSGPSRIHRAPVHF